MIGSRLAHYEITSHLGSGGMGDVYQATDSKLGRSVAIKLLPETFANDADRAARFEREARVLASLNHPHIAAIYGLEESGQRKFLVMELAAGETLAERIARGPIPIDEALAIAAQIAEALESAHDKGVIHRDLKPANIKITPDGQVKVLDFGLAKAFAGESANMNLSNSPTISMAATSAGLILGTAAYMSPEQAKGQNVDRRTDIFAFGAVLYEMLTGKQAFAGETVSDILSRVILAEPDWSRLPNATPVNVRRLLQRCLQKDRNLRLRDAGDARLDLLEPRVGIDPAAPQSKVRERLAWISALVVAVAVTATAAVLIFRTPVADAPETRVDIVTPQTFAPASFAISPDGRKLAFVAREEGQQRLWVRPLEGTTAQPLAGTEDASQPFWSPDSKSIGFFTPGTLKRADLGGGLPQKLADTFGNSTRGGAWSPDGVILFAGGTYTPLSRIPASGGQTFPATKLDAPRQTGHRFPHFLPDGRQFLFSVDGTSEVAGIYLGSLDSPETKLLTPADTAGLYVQSGWLLFVRQGTLVARRFDLERGELSGDPVTVANQVIFNQGGVGDQAAFSVSAGGVIAYRTGEAGTRQLTWFDRSGTPVGTLGAVDSSLIGPMLSPDGQRAAVHRTIQSNTDVWIIDAVRTSRFTFDATGDVFPIWSPDGARIAFDSARTGVRNLYLKSSDGTRNEELLFESPLSKTAHDWSHDERYILYSVVDPKTGRDLWVLPIQGERKPFAFLNTGAEDMGSQFSPDSRWVAYQSNESGTFEIYVRPFPGPGGQWLVSTGGGVQVRWSRDGKELYYIDPEGKLMVAPIVVKGNAIEPGTPAPLFQTRIWGGGTNFNQKQQYDVAPDGRFLINVTTDDGVASPITLLLNWKPPAN